MMNSILFIILMSIGGTLANEVQCHCNNHAETCNQETGECACLHNTTGPNCEMCADGFYGYPLNGTPDDCRPCPCPFNGPCVEVPNGDVVCTKCPEGQAGSLCEICDNNYFGDPMAKGRESQPCQKCECNFNIDPSAIGNCDNKTGECLKCLYDTDGFYCQKCRKGFAGNAHAIHRPGLPNDCQPCQCNILGTITEPETFIPICDDYSAKCSCKKNVVGWNCDGCADGFYRFASGEGCDPCDCDPAGSTNNSCNMYTGQCNCRSGFTGRQCDQH